MIGHVTNELRHHKFREDRMAAPGHPSCDFNDGKAGIGHSDLHRAIPKYLTPLKFFPLDFEVFFYSHSYQNTYTGLQTLVNKRIQKGSGHILGES